METAARRITQQTKLEKCGRRVSTLVAFLDGIAENTPTPCCFGG
jgi:hypothetical protein